MRREGEPYWWRHATAVDLQRLADAAAEHPRAVISVVNRLGNLVCGSVPADSSGETVCVIEAGCPQNPDGSFSIDPKANRTYNLTMSGASKEPTR